MKIFPLIAKEKTRSVLWIACFALCGAILLDRSSAPTIRIAVAPAPVRSLIIAVSSNAPPEMQAAAQAILAATKTQPLLELMANGGGAKIISSEDLLSGPPAQLEFNHLVVVGSLQDPLVQALWQREAKVEDGGLFVFGFGHLKGDIGYIESDRNPYLHGEKVARTPFEAEEVTITGTTPKGVAMAASAFVDKGLVNGVAAAPGWIRPTTTILDRDPVASDFKLPDVPATLGGARLIAVTQAGEDEYRSVLSDCNIEPASIWRFKYYPDGAWDDGGVNAAIKQYNAGLHRRAFANMLWVAEFSSQDQARQSAEKIASAGDMKPSGDGAWTRGKAADADQSPPSAMWQRGSLIYMTTLSHVEIPH